MFSLQFCRAQIDVPASISFDLGGSDAPDTQLWDLSGDYRLDLVVVKKDGVSIPMRLSFSLIQDANGHLSSPAGVKTDEMEITDNGFFAVAPKISGKVTGFGGNARVHFTIHVHGNGTLANQPVNSVSAVLNVDAETDPSSGELVGTKVTKFSANLTGVGSVSGNADFSTAMPHGANAAWNLTMQIAALKKLTGNAVVTTPGRAIGFDLSGDYKTKSGNFKIAAKGAKNVPNTLSGVGSKATIRLTPPFDSLVFNGRLLGQKLAFSFPED
jgi:hypothetical protein